jgi:acetyl-CoA carboxylase alpha subunit
MTRLRTPIVTVITGEGGSGGALAIAVGDVVIALENAVYSVISPEGCASILWRTADEAATAGSGDAHVGGRSARARRGRHRGPGAR